MSANKICAEWPRVWQGIVLNRCLLKKAFLGALLVGLFATTMFLQPLVYAGELRSRGYATEFSPKIQSAIGWWQ